MKRRPSLIGEGLYRCIKVNRFVIEEFHVVIISTELDRLESVTLTIH